MLLPGDAELRVRLLDISTSDATSAAVVAEHTGQLSGAPPFQFDLRFDPAKVHPQGAYAVEAEIRIGGKRHFASPEPKRVTIADSAPAVEITVKRTE
jgi:putative lipoprotein